MALVMMENGLKVNFMDKVYTHGLMVLHMMEVINMDWNMGMESMFTLRKIFIKESGLKDWDMDEALFSTNEETLSRKVFGIKVSS